MNQSKIRKLKEDLEFQLFDLKALQLKSRYICKINKCPRLECFDKFDVSYDIIDESDCGCECVYMNLYCDDLSEIRKIEDTNIYIDSIFDNLEKIKIHNKKEIEFEIQKNNFVRQSVNLLNGESCQFDELIESNMNESFCFINYKQNGKDIRYIKFGNCYGINKENDFFMSPYSNELKNHNGGKIELKDLAKYVFDKYGIILTQCPILKNLRIAINEVLYNINDNFCNSLNQRLNGSQLLSSYNGKDFDYQVEYYKYTIDEKNYKNLLETIY